MLAWFLGSIVSVFEFRSRYINWLSPNWRPLFPGERLSESSENGKHHSFHFGENSQGRDELSLIEFGAADSLLQDRMLWLWTSGFEVLLHALYLLTLLPGSHLEPRHYRHRSHANDIVYNAYESQENNSFVGFDEEDESELLPLGVAKENSGYISRLLFLWVNPLIRKGACGYLTTCESLFDLPHSISTGIVATEFQATISRRMSLLRALHVCFGVQFYSIGFLKLTADASGFCGPILLNCLVSYIEDTGDDVSKESIWIGYTYVGGMFAALFVG